MEFRKASIKESFARCSSNEEIYRKIIDWGKSLLPYENSWKNEENRVAGCQSQMYLHSELKENKLHFFAHSDALISAGLAAILVYYYTDTSPEEIIKNSPSFLEEIGIPGALTPGRANGLASLYIKMKQEALKCLIAFS